MVLHLCLLPEIHRYQLVPCMTLLDLYRSEDIHFKSVFNQRFDREHEVYELMLEYPNIVSIVLDKLTRESSLELIRKIIIKLWLAYQGNVACLMTDKECQMLSVFYREMATRYQDVVIFDIVQFATLIKTIYMDLETARVLLPFCKSYGAREGNFNYSLMFSRGLELFSIQEVVNFLRNEIVPLKPNMTFTDDLIVIMTNFYGKYINQQTLGSILDQPNVRAEIGRAKTRQQIRDSLSKHGCSEQEYHLLTDELVDFIWEFAPLLC